MRVSSGDALCCGAPVTADPDPRRYLRGIIFNVTGISFQQAVTPDRMLGHLNATRRFIVWGVILVGEHSPVDAAAADA